jgi:hypothetical protein
MGVEDTVLRLSWDAWSSRFCIASSTPSCSQRLVPQAMVLRRQTVEHPFGTIKAWMGANALSHQDAEAGQQAMIA